MELVTKRLSIYISVSRSAVDGLSLPYSFSGTLFLILGFCSKNQVTIS